MKSECKNMTAIICIFCLLVGITGCKSSDKADRESKKTLTVIAETMFRRTVEEAADYMMEKDPDMEVKIQFLPDNQEKRETEIQKLRTQIMAGDGPDVYLLDNLREDTTVSQTPLFENPYKTMQSGALASLERYMEEDTYWENGTYKKEFLTAGQYEGKQYMIPLSCSYEVLMSETADIENLSDKTLGEWLEEAKQSDNERLKEVMRGRDMTAGRWIYNAADYEKQEVFFDKQKWKTFYISYHMYRKSEWEQYIEPKKEGDVFGRSDRVDFIDDSIKAVALIPDLEGRRQAWVQAFGAVGMSCEDKESAYQFLMLFLNNEIETERSKQGKDTFVKGCIDIEIPVQESAIESRWKEIGISDEKVQIILESFREVEGAYFTTSVEQFLTNSVEEASWRCDDPNIDLTQWEAEASEFAEKAWNDYNMLVSE